MAWERSRGPQDHEGNLRILTGSSLEGLAKQILQETPEAGHFRPLAFRYIIPGTDNYAQFLFSHPYTAAADHRTLTLEVFRRDTDVSYTVFLHTGTKAELLAIMAEAAFVPVCIDHIHRLSDKVDARWAQRG